MEEWAWRATLSNLVADVAYGSTKELLRALLAASMTTLLFATRPQGAANSWKRAWRTYRWIELLKLCGSLALVLLCVFFVVERFPSRCDAEQPLCGFVPGYRKPPPPPPPPLEKIAQRTREVAASTVAYCQKHPFQIAASFGAIFLADLVNIAIVIDSFDPVVRLVSLLGSPIRRVAAFVWRQLLRQRGQAAAKAAGKRVARRFVRAAL